VILPALTSFSISTLLFQFILPAGYWRRKTTLRIRADEPLADRGNQCWAPRRIVHRASYRSSPNLKGILCSLVFTNFCLRRVRRKLTVSDPSQSLHVSVLCSISCF